MEDERQQRWAVSDSELDRLPELRADDELIGTWNAVDGDGVDAGERWSVVVLRDGTVTNRNHDGTVGVPEEVREHLGDEDTLFHPVGDGVEETSRWVEVVVAPDGSFLRLADEPSAAPGM